MIRRHHLMAGALAPFAAIVVLTAGQAQAPNPRCSLTHPNACRDTNDLAWSSGFKAVVKRFVGPGNGPINGIKDAGEAVTLALGGPPEPPAHVPGGGWLFAACEAHDCPVKGALLLGPDNRIRGAGVFNFQCEHGDCENLPRLDLFLRDRHDVEAQFMLTQWANAEIARDLAQFPTAAAQRLSGVRVRPARRG